MLRRIFGSKEDEIIRWRNLNNEELEGLYSLCDTIMVIKSRRLRKVGQ